ncbi:MFS transporter [Mycolicibacterium conceptionense]|uniref:MFS transporter n=1 Tax=Mycolicibacterium conceptionense TaxID=451644 RepID=UPI0009BB46CC|nr:MFS transporter [Mycolicibacterium conceptionense]
MDGSILYLAMPSINDALAPTTDQSLWILDIYGFAVGSLLITFGNLGDRIGRKKLLLAGATVFGAGSLCAAFSPAPELLIASRGLMGLGGATLLPSCLAVISELFENPTQRARAIGVYAATFAAGIVVGPIVGGLMLGHFWWGSVFLINVPVVVVFLCVAPILFRDAHTSSPGQIDLSSVALSVAGLLLTVYGVKHAATYELDWQAAVSIATGVCAIVAFLRRQGRLDLPLLDLRLFKERVFAVAILTGLLSLVVWAAAAYLSMTYLQSVLGYSVLGAAALAVPGALVLTLSCVLTPHLVERVGSRSALVLCHLFTAAGMALLVFTGTTHGVHLYIASTMVAGVGFGIAFSLVADTAVGAVPPSRSGAAGSIAETSNELGHALGIAVLGSLATLVFRTRYAGGETGIGEVVNHHGVSSAAYAQARSAFLAGFHAVAATAAVICLVLGAFAAWRIPRHPVPQRPEPAPAAAPGATRTSSHSPAALHAADLGRSE